MPSRRDQIEPRVAATWVAERLRTHGHAAFFAGGCVRDRLLGLEPSDFDVVTDARPDRIRELFNNAVGVGESFGVMLVRRGGQAIEVATFRSDGVYEDGRRPVSVTYSDDRSDAARRDFTVNAIFEDPWTLELVDHFGGEDDLRSGILRAVGVAADRFAEDHLRALRAVRFAARFDFEVEADTAAAIRACSGDLEGVSRERIGGEIRRMLMHPNRTRACELLEGFGLDVPVLQEPACDSGDRTALDALGVVDRPPMDALAAWVIDRHGEGDREICDRLRDALLFSNHEHAALLDLFEVHRLILAEWRALGVAGRKRLAVRPGFEVALALAAVREPSLAVEIEEALETLRADGLAPTPFIDGNDLIEAGLTPGPRFKSILHAVYDAQLDGTLTDRSQALGLARSLGAEH